MTSKWTKRFKVIPVTLKVLVFPVSRGQDRRQVQSEENEPSSRLNRTSLDKDFKMSRSKKHRRYIRTADRKGHRPSRQGQSLSINFSRRAIRIGAGADKEGDVSLIPALITRSAVSTYCVPRVSPSESFTFCVLLHIRNISIWSVGPNKSEA